MGRYITGDIEHKFWFGVQSSDAADRFGSTGYEPNYLEYYYTKDDLQEVLDELKRIRRKWKKYFPKLIKFFNHNLYYSDSDLMKHLNIDKKEYSKLIADYADYILGRKIAKYLIQHGDCMFTAEL